MQHKSISVKWVLLGVYGAVSIATFYHSMWGFATLAGDEPNGWWAAAAWWLIGALMAAAVDVGMAAIVYARVTGNRQGWLVIALCVLAGASAYTQIIYAAHHATAYEVGAVAGWLAWLAIVLDARVIILPVLLPAFALVYAFAAHGDIVQPEVAPPAKPMLERKSPQPAKVAEIAPITSDLQGASIEKRRAMVPQLLKAKKTQGEIAEMFGVSPSAISRDVRALNGKAS